jgi:hypothetical protein
MDAIYNPLFVTGLRLMYLAGKARATDKLYGGVRLSPPLRNPNTGPDMHNQLLFLTRHCCSAKVSPNPFKSVLSSTPLGGTLPLVVVLHCRCGVRILRTQVV